MTEDLLQHLDEQERIAYGIADTTGGFVGDLGNEWVRALLQRLALERQKVAALTPQPPMNRPKPVTQDELVDLLEFITASVKAGDSFEGSLEYMMPDPEDYDEHADPRTHPYAMVMGAVRTGNAMGQGGVMFIGTGLGH